MRSVHERHRLALAELESGAHLPLVERAARSLGLAAAHPPVTVRSGLRTGTGPYADLVVSLGPRPQDAVSVECWVTRPHAADPVVLAQAGAMGWIGVTPLTDDAVVATATQLGGTSATLMRYHRGRRATVRVTDPECLPGCAVAYAKVFNDDRAVRRHEQGRQLADAAASGRVAMRVPRPALFDAARHVLWQHAVDGVPATDRLTGPEGPALATRMGAALGSLHTSDLVPTRRLTTAGQAMRAERYAAEAARLVPDLGGRVLRLLDEAGSGSSPGDEKMVPVHGSPDPSQWLVGSGPVPGLLDFDRFGWGEPESDLACFVIEVEALGRGLFSAAVSAGFLAGYRSVAGPVDPDAMRRHTVLRRVGKVVRAARALRVDGDRRAARVLAAAEHAAGEPMGVTPGVGR